MFFVNDESALLVAFVKYTFSKLITIVLKNVTFTTF